MQLKIYKNRLSVFDCLKGICMIFVIIIHNNISDKAYLTLLFPFHIQMDVPIFMIISGYMYSLSSSSKGISSTHKWFSVNNLFSKISRIIIPYTVVYIFELLNDFIKLGGYNRFTKSEIIWWFFI